jgi:para-nitrobenzyl esterase
MKAAVLCAIVLASVCVLPAQTICAAEPIHVEQGDLSGVAGRDTKIEVFKGIPFAAPPIGELRWRPPEPPASWHGVRKADRFSATCMQTWPEPGSFYYTEFYQTTEPMDEDCLYLNIWTGGRGPGEHRPVMVWMYGGAFVQGSGSMPIYDGEALARKGVVLVTFNYRLGPFGWMALPELTEESPHHSSGNYGLLDQIAALRWIQKNIAAFGGDPGRVTIFGQSAGAMSVNLLMVSPSAKGLFQRAISHSGNMFGFFGPMPSREKAEKGGTEFTNLLGTSSLAGLRALSARDIVAHLHGGYFIRYTLWPNVDGWVVPEEPPAVFARGEETHVPVMLGATADEGTTIYPPVAPEAFAEQMRRKYGSDAASFLSLYPHANDAEVIRSQGSMLRDELLAGDLIEAGVAARQGNPSRVYLFDHPLPGRDSARYGAWHSSDLVYVFGTLEATGRPWEVIDQRLSDQISSYWVNFAATGDPNGSGLPAWPAFDPKQRDVQELGSHVGPIPAPDAARLEFFDRRLRPRLSAQ